MKFTKIKQAGVGLLEILISILIGTILVLAITTMYGNFIGASKLQQEQSTAQDQANFAFLALNRAVRMAGAGLCVNPAIESATYLHQTPDFSKVFPPIITHDPSIVTDNGQTKFSAASRLHSFAVTNSNKNQLGGTNVQPGSDALFVIYSSSKTRRLKDSVSGTATNPYQKRIFAEPRTIPKLNTSADAKAGDPLFNYDKKTNKILPTWLMISDCSHTGIFKYKEKDVASDGLLAPRQDPDGSGGLADLRSFKYNFGGNGQTILAAKLYAFLYYVAKDSDGHSQLYRKDLLNSLGDGTDAIALAADVTNMKIQYKQGGRWIDTSARTNWNSKLPVRITLTLNAGPQLGEQKYTRILDSRN